MRPNKGDETRRLPAHMGPRQPSYVGERETVHIYHYDSNLANFPMTQDKTLQPICLITSLSSGKVERSTAKLRGQNSWL
jgi:hypothetical protein